MEKFISHFNTYIKILNMKYKKKILITGVAGLLVFIGKKNT